MTDFEVPTPVDRDRVKHFLCELDQSDDTFTYHEYGEHEFIFPMENAILFVGFENPSILQLRGQWRGIAVDDEGFAALTQQVHLCNLLRSGPKAYLMPFEDATKFGLGAEVNMVISKGATTEQLTNFYEVALTMIVGFFKDVEDEIPELVTWREAE